MKNFFDITSVPILNNFAKIKPKTLFLVDCFGAFTTAFLLFAILRTFNEYVGLPKIILTYLSIIAAIFCMYSGICFLWLRENWQPFLKVISIANLLYSCLTLCLLIYYRNSLTIFGIVYFLGEIMVVCGLVFIELNILKKYISEETNSLT